MSGPFKKFLVNTGLLVVSTVTALFFGGALYKAIDTYFIEQPTHQPLLMAGIEDWGINAATVELYPYDGWHVVPNFTWTGRVEGHEYNVTSGSHGFYVDFDLDHPPLKEPNEFRIILIGGSAAQGFHGTSNDKMFYKLLEDRLAKAFKGRKRIRLINLAMGSSVSYQNFIALNIWGHKLQPDLIISYSGRNDYEMLGWQKNQAYWRFEALQGLSMIGRLDKSPGWLRWLHELYPNTINGSDNFSLIVRLMNLRELTARSNRDFTERFGYGPPEETYKNVILDAYVNALKSIKRDFSGIPMMIVYQPWTAGAHYDQFRADSRAALRGYQNNDWTFFDLQQVIKDRDLFKTILMPNDDCHNSDIGHAIVTDLLEQPVRQLVEKLITRAVKSR